MEAHPSQLNYSFTGKAASIWSLFRWEICLLSAAWLWCLICSISGFKIGASGAVLASFAVWAQFRLTRPDSLVVQLMGLPHGHELVGRDASSTRSGPPIVVWFEVSQENRNAIRHWPESLLPLAKLANLDELRSRTSLLQSPWDARGTATRLERKVQVLVTATLILGSLLWGYYPAADPAWCS